MIRPLDLIVRLVKLISEELSGSPPEAVYQQGRPMKPMSVVIVNTIKGTSVKADQFDECSGFW